jgi:hypothetical protein
LSGWFLQTEPLKLAILELPVLLEEDIPAEVKEE